LTLSTLPIILNYFVNYLPLKVRFTYISILPQKKNIQILIAPDSFKDALSSTEVAQALAGGLKVSFPEAAVHLFPLADGGEGTLEAIQFRTQAQWMQETVQDPLGRPIVARWLWQPEQKRAFIELAEASGLQLLSAAERDALQTSTFGTGQLILAAVRKGARHIVLAIGGSATNDAGMGIAAALGYRFWDQQQQELKPVGANLAQIYRIDSEEIKIDLKKLRIEVLCDVDNPLYGQEGAAFVYAPQKGADPQQVEELDQGLRHLAWLIPGKLEQTPGAGAAGGVGYGGMIFLQASLQPGIDTILEYTGFSDLLEQVDLVLTGEGKIDEQSLRGKLIQGLCVRARQFDVPVIAVCGSLMASPEIIRQMGLQAAFSILTQPMSLQEALQQTPAALHQAGAQIGNMLQLAI
jgi:glycerate kinase